ncbi:MAG: asparagine synthase (glutamine-hydrolyzing) [Cytophagales bacterium]|nr:asparagine synthase (glutamine-hydrolyzing) [Cytophagales bacterium]MCA6368362.1 asparagine synthase (glutamine-hydrolyzing) [Cytophagales bacterium]MCA6371441.1 asparagine synthase (glutamine-hydrolyzing) [Cytophagales bacterium]MCA6374831.1 asparagine synthase (glutamine-hydrolyzing) [Cytophagales bacterium]MCA6385049.1 asparagine synthase (glutamine-hydrolyzing) [Cytophagales bacterium]
MCGISGIVSRQFIETQSIESLTNSLMHRGPDAKNVYLNKTSTTALGHTRLSIIDLSEQANQPMRSQDGRLIVVFNGEIYNYRDIRKELQLVNSEVRFTTNSDTEIIVHAFACWGMEMVHRLQGMFSIAIYDTLLDKVFLFRDRLGKKPLYYYCDHQHFIFASEIKALLKHPAVSSSKEIDKQAVHEFLHLGYIPEPKTIYRSIRKFPAGSIGEVWSNLSFSFYPYWKADDEILQQNMKISDATLKESLKEKLHAAVQKRLVSDVPLGAFLSGGTDSSLVTAIASEYTTGTFKTFGIGFKENAFDEHRYAAQVASELKLDHCGYILSESEAADILETYLHHLDEPFADTSTIPTMLVSRLARKEVKVALTGDGGDELFLGYGTYTWAKRLKNPLFRLVQTPLTIGLSKLGSARYRRISRLLLKVERQQLRSHIFSQEQNYFSDKEMSDELLRTTLDYEPFRYTDPKDTSRFSEEEKQALFDLRFYLKDDLLVKVDRASMFHGLECRCPLLDQNVIAFALSAPLTVKRRGGVNKWILKELLKDYLPDRLIYRPKWGFSVPLSRWLRNEFKYLIEDNLNSKIVAEIGLVKVDYVENLKKSFMMGEDYLYNRIWILVVLHKWLKENG